MAFFLTMRALRVNSRCWGRRCGLWRRSPNRAPSCIFRSNGTPGRSSTYIPRKLRRSPVSQAAPVVCSELLEPDTPGGFRPGCPLNNATTGVTPYLRRRLGKAHPPWVLRNANSGSLLEWNGAATGRTAPSTRTIVRTGIPGTRPAWLSP